MAGSIAGRFGFQARLDTHGSGDVEMTVAEAMAREIYATALDLGLVKDIRPWDGRKWKEGDWDMKIPGLTDDEKQKWIEVAEAALCVA